MEDLAPLIAMIIDSGFSREKNLAYILLTRLFCLYRGCIFFHRSFLLIACIEGIYIVADLLKQPPCWFTYTLIGVSVSEDLWELWSSSTAAVCERKEIVECLNACNGKYIEIDQL